MVGSLDRYLARVHLPYPVVTHGCRTVLRTADDLAEVFRALSEGLAAKDVTEYVRLAREASFGGPDGISGTHYTHAISDGQRVFPPHISAQTIHRIDGTWRFTSARYALDNKNWPIDTPLAGVRADELPRTIVQELTTNG
jgi:hypothetical protein